jgi:hypothetical protein
MRLRWNIELYISAGVSVAASKLWSAKSRSHPGEDRCPPVRPHGCFASAFHVIFISFTNDNHEALATSYSHALVTLPLLPALLNSLSSLISYFFSLPNLEDFKVESHHQSEANFHKPPKHTQQFSTSGFPIDQGIPCCISLEEAYGVFC